jgi:hypothetical protein
LTYVRTGCSLLFALLGAGACAHVEAPPGGPEDRTPPAILTTRPEPGSLVPGFEVPVVIEFAERISERSVDDAVTVSPRTSPAEVEAGRSEIRVSLRDGWEPGAIYHVGVSRNVQDLFNNRLAEPIRLVFSTGPDIPETLLTGTVIDRITGRPETEVRVEAIRTDSLVYAASIDSVGGFEIAQFPEGEYQVRAFRDLNRNRALDPFEARDTASVEVLIGQDAEVALRVVEPDSTAPVPGSASLAQGVIQVEFDDYLEPDQPIAADQVTIRDSTGAVVPIDTVAIGELLPIIPDTVAPDLPADTAPPPPAPPDPTAPPQPGVAGPPAPGVAPGDLPSRTLAIRLAADAELVPEAEYTVVIEGVENVVGLTGGGETTFTAPEQPPEEPPDQPGAAPL